MSLLWASSGITLASNKEKVLDEHIDQAKAVSDIDQAKAVGEKRKGSFLVVPIPMSNPTVGSGLQAALLYLHPQKTTAKDAPNATSGLGLMYTDTESWAAGLFHDDYLMNDKLRLRSILGSGELNIHYYGLSDNSTFENSPIEYALAVDLLMLQALMRFPKTEHWFAGFKFLTMENSVSFHLDDLIPGLPELHTDAAIAGMSLVANYDSRDNNYYPSSGTLLEANFGRFNEHLGSDFNFHRRDVALNHYFLLADQHILATRLFADVVDGDAPFYVYPSLQLRGFPAGRYQDKAAISVHTEWRHKFSPRWGLMASFEAGSVGASVKDAWDSKPITSVGAGIRWQVAKDQKLHLGLDVGFSGDEQAFYLKIGEKF